MEAYLRAAGSEAACGDARCSVAVRSRPAAPAAVDVPDADALRMGARLPAALGGRAKSPRARAEALTRLRVRLRDDTLLDEAALRRAGVAAIMRIQAACFT